MKSLQVESKKMIQINYLQGGGRLSDLGNKLMVASGRDGETDRLEVWDLYVYTAMFKTDYKWGPTTRHRELRSISYNGITIVFLNVFLNGKTI